VHPVGFYYTDVSRFTVNKTLKNCTDWITKEPNYAQIQCSKYTKKSNMVIYLLFY